MEGGSDSAGRLQRLRQRFRIGAYLFDRKFAANRGQYMLQCAFVGISMLLILLTLDAFYQTVLIAALGASSVVAFSAPSMRVSRPRCLIGGYVVGVTVGCGLSLLASMAAARGLPVEGRTLGILFGAVAVGLAMFIMVITNTEHPPGAAVALGFVLNDWQPMTIVIVLAGIVLISLVKELARERLIDLL